MEEKVVQHGAEAVGHVVHGPGAMELIQLINLAVVILIVYFMGRKAVVAAVRSRSEGFSQKLLNSKRELERVQAELAQAKADIERIDEIKKQMLAQVRSEGEKLAASILVDAKNVAERIRSDALVATEDETRMAVRKLRQMVVDESIKRSVATLTESSGHSSENKVHEKLVQKFVSDVKLPSGINGAHKNG